MVDSEAVISTPKGKGQSKGCDNVCGIICSVCRSPMSVSNCMASGDEDEVADTPEGDENARGVGNRDGGSDSGSGSGDPRSVTKTRCGHFFHKACLLEVKIRKAECPMCRSQLTPVSNPATVATAIETQSLQPSSMRDAVIHASIRARNAVRRSLELQQRNRELEEQQSAYRLLISAQ